MNGNIRSRKSRVSTALGSALASKSQTRSSCPISPAASIGNRPSLSVIRAALAFPCPDDSFSSPWITCAELDRRIDEAAIMRGVRPNASRTIACVGLVRRACATTGEGNPSSTTLCTMLNRSLEWAVAPLVMSMTSASHCRSPSDVSGNRRPSVSSCSYVSTIRSHSKSNGVLPDLSASKTPPHVQLPFPSLTVHIPCFTSSALCTPSFLPSCTKYSTNAGDIPPLLPSGSTAQCNGILPSLSRDVTPAG